MKGYITLKTVFGEHEHDKEMKLRYLIIDGLSSYNIIIGRSNFNKLGITLSTGLKCPLSDGQVGVIQGDQ